MTAERPSMMTTTIAELPPAAWYRGIRQGHGRTQALRR
jgi:hypothetical protein